MVLGGKTIIVLRKENPTDTIYWGTEMQDDGINPGRLLVSFDKKKIYNLWEHYPYCMTEEEVQTFDKENPYWADFFKWRKDPSKFDEEDKETPWYKAWEKKHVQK